MDQMQTTLFVEDDGSWPFVSGYYWAFVQGGCKIIEVEIASIPYFYEMGKEGTSLLSTLEGTTLIGPIRSPTLCRIVLKTPERVKTEETKVRPGFQFPGADLFRGPTI